MLWLKLNIYSLLLCLLFCMILLVFFLFPALRVWWIYIFAIPGSLALLKKAEDIFRQYPHKVEVYHTLIHKAEKKFDQRYFVPYMGTACMRSVVYWSLVYTGNQTEYSKIKKRFAEEHQKQPPEKIVAGVPKTVSVTMQNGKLHFQTIQTRLRIENDEMRIL